VLQGAVAVHSGIALLEPNSIRVEGGHVAALHEAWVMQKKYSGSLARASLDGVTGPPPFRALPIGLKGAQMASNATSHPGEHTSHDKHFAYLTVSMTFYDSL